MEENNIILFEEKSLEVMKKLKDLKTEKDRLDKIDEELRQKLQEKMNEYNIKSFKNDYVTITNIEPSKTISVDLKKLEEEEPDTYKGLIEDFPKVKNTKGCVRIVVK